MKVQILNENILFSLQQDSSEPRPSDKAEKRKEVPTASESPTQQPQPTEPTSEMAQSANGSASADRDEDEDVVNEETRKAGSSESSRKSDHANGASATTVGMTSTGEPLRLVTCTQCSIVDGAEVHIEERPIHVAEYVLTPIGKPKYLYIFEHIRSVTQLAGPFVNY